MNKWMNDWIKMKLMNKYKAKLTHWNNKIDKQ